MYTKQCCAYVSNVGLRRVETFLLETMEPRATTDSSSNRCSGKTMFSKGKND